jgi:hypothetical protein
MKAREAKKRQESEAEKYEKSKHCVRFPALLILGFVVLQVIKPFPIPAPNTCRLRYTPIPITSQAKARDRQKHAGAGASPRLFSVTHQW